MLRCKFAARLVLSALAFILIAARPLHAQAKLTEAKQLHQEARTAAAQREWDVALDRYHRAIHLAPAELDLRIDLAAVLKTMGRYPEAIAAFQEALTMSPQSEAAQLGLADSYRLAFNYDDARRWMERARQEHPKSAAPLVALGELAIQFQKYDEAIQRLQVALRINPKDVSTRNDLALAHHGAGDFDKSLEILNGTLARDPKNAFALYLRGRIYSDRNDTARALPDAENLFALQPNERARLLLAKLQVRAGQCARAVVTLEPLTVPPQESSDALYLLRQAYQCSGQDEEAKQTMTRFEEASQRDHLANESNAQAIHLVSEAGELARSNQFDKAIELLQQAIAMNPNDGAAYSQLAKIEYSQGRIAEAHDAIGQALAQNRYHPDYLFVLGKILEREGKMADALQTFEQVTLVRPGESDSYYEMGLIFQQRKDRARAVASFKKAVELSPEDADYRRALAAASAGDSP